MSDFFRLIILSANSFGEFGTDSLVCSNLEYAYRVGNDCCQSENVYGYVIVKMMKNNTWQIITETVYGVDYTIYEHNGDVRVKEGRDKIVLV